MKKFLWRPVLTTMCALTLLNSAAPASFATFFKSNKQPLKPQTAALDSTPIAATPPSTATPLFKIHAGTGVSQEYILGPGDVLSVTDTSEDKPTTSIAPILPDGTAVTSYTGVVRAAGITLREMNDLVNEKAKKWYVNPSIIVNLAKQRPVQVYLLGEVLHPGLYTVGSDAVQMPRSGGSEGMEGGGDAGDESAPASQTSSNNTITVSGAIQLAGGLKETADVRHLRVTRKAPKETYSIDLWKLMIDGDVSEDIVLQPNDVIYVPKGGGEFNPNDLGNLVNNKPKVRIIGAVKSPGLFPMSPDDDIMSVIAKAGGFQDFAVTSHILLARTNRDGTVTSENIAVKKGIADSRSELRKKIRSGDVIVVKRSAAKTIGMTVGRTLPQMVSSALMQVLLEQTINKTNR